MKTIFVVVESERSNTWGPEDPVVCGFETEEEANGSIPILRKTYKMMDPRKYLVVRPMNLGLPVE